MKYAAYRQLQTPRLTLRSFRPEDAASFFTRLAGNEKVTKSMMWITHHELSQSEETIRKILLRQEAGKAYCWAIALPETDELIGRIDLLGFEEEKESCSFAYMLSPDHWNKGYGTEAVKAVFDFAFRELEIQTITADHFADNPASGAVMVKAGMTRMGVTPLKYQKEGQLHDAVHYRISKEDWITK